MALNFSEPTRRPVATFKALQAEYSHAEFIGNATVTKRLVKAGVKVFAAPRTVRGGYRGKLGRIDWAAAIDRNDKAAMAAMKAEFEKLQ